MRHGRLAVVALMCFAALFPVGLPARPPVVISGKVTDARGQPIPGALIAVPALNESTVSDDGGMYRLAIRSKARPGQDVVIRASREGLDYVSQLGAPCPQGPGEDGFSACASEVRIAR